MSPVLSALIALMVVCIVALVKKRYVGFDTQRPADLADRGPKFDPRTHLSGPILCEGVVYGPTGRVSSRFVADMEGVWTGNTGVLKERFRYDNGNVQDRQWTLRMANDGSIAAEAPDVIGIGVGRAEGPAVEMRYRIKLAPEAGGHVLDVVDWMYLMDNGTIMNRSQFRKFGITVAELVATLRRVPA